MTPPVRACCCRRYHRCCATAAAAAAAAAAASATRHRCCCGMPGWGVQAEPTRRSPSSPLDLSPCPPSAPLPTRAVDSVPPLVTGDNMDNRRVGKGNTLYLPVQVAGAYLSMGDAHMAQVPAAAGACCRRCGQRCRRCRRRRRRQARASSRAPTIRHLLGCTPTASLASRRARSPPPLPSWLSAKMPLSWMAPVWRPSCGGLPPPPAAATLVTCHTAVLCAPSTPTGRQRAGRHRR